MKRLYYLLLLRLERTFKFDARYYFHNGLWLSAGQGAASLLAFGLGIAFANLLSPDEFGVYKYALSIAGLCAAFALPEMGTAVIRAVSRGREGVLGPSVVAQLRWGALGTLACLVVAAHAWARGAIAEASALVVAAVFLSPFNSYGVYDAVLRGRKDFRRATAYGVAFQLFLSAALLATLLAGGGALVVAAVYFGASTLLRVAFYRRVAATVPADAPADPGALSYGKHLSVVKAIGLVAGQASQVVLYQAVGPGALSAYFVAIAPAEQARGWLTILGQLFFSRASAPGWEVPTPAAYLRRIAPLLAATVGFCAAYALLAQAFFGAFFPRYLGTVAVSRLYMFTLPLTVATIPLTTIAKAKGAVKALHVLNAINVGAALGLSLPATYFFGAAGLVASIFALKAVELAWLSYAVFFRLRRNARAA